MTASRKLLLSTLVGSALSGVYWIGFLFVAYGLTAGDPRPGGEGSDGGRIAAAVAVWLVGFLIFAGLAALWRRIDFRLAGHR